MHNIDKNHYWSNVCGDFPKCTEQTCDCYANYVLFSKDFPKADFTIWKELIKVEYEQL